MGDDKNLDEFVVVVYKVLLINWDGGVFGGIVICEDIVCFFVCDVGSLVGMVVGV